MEKCSNFENCGNTLPKVKDDEIPFQFCSKECKKFITKKEANRNVKSPSYDWSGKL
jgi:hypothetical protein